MKPIQLIFNFLLIIGVAACTSTPVHMSAGNDEDSDTGLGGTGLLANKNEDNDNGLGGTGILGKITGFGSIFVNGIEIEYDNKTPFTINGKTGITQQLEIGDIVEVLTLDNRKHTRAVTINLRHEIIGKVESTKAETFSFKINGQTIIQPINKSRLPEVGSVVAVSGFRVNDDTIVSSRVTPAGPEQRLLRTHTGLPFKDKADNWLIQMHVQNKAVFHLGGSAHSVMIQEQTKTPENHLKVKILKLQKSVSGQLELKQMIKPQSIPSGRNSVTPESGMNQHNMHKLIQGEGFRVWQRTGSGTTTGIKNRPFRNQRN